MSKIIASISLFIVAMAFFAIVATWPYGWRLLKEGFPSYQWPASGDFAEVKGLQDAPALRRVSVAPGEWTSTLFEKSKGKMLMVMHGGDIKLQLGTNDVSSRTKFNSFSMVKSLVGLLVLKAHADGLIEDLADPLGRYLPEFSTPDIRAVSISMFLQMRSGLDFEIDSKVIFEGDQPKLKRSVNYSPFSQMTRLHMQGLRKVADHLVVADKSGAGPEWRYQNVNTAILAHLLEAVYDRPVEKVLSEFIWKPSGAQTAFWRRYGEGRSVSAYCCLYASAEDWLRVGRFILTNGGEGSPFLPSPLWRRFLGADVQHDQRYHNAYGDHVYHNLLDRKGEALSGNFSYFMGNGGQMLYLMPDKDLVVVRFGEGLPLLHSTLYAIWRDIEG